MTADSTKHGVVINNYMSTQVTNRAWYPCVKLCHNVPRSTHTYLVENVLASEFTPIRTEIMARYGKFYSSLKKSISTEVQFMSRIVMTDVRSTTSRNLTVIRRETGINTLVVSARNVREAVPRREIPVNQFWRSSLLQKLLKQRREMDNQMVDTTLITGMIDSLCSS